MQNYGERLDKSTVRFERILPGPIERVWAYITESDKRAKWLCSGDIENKTGGHVDMHFNNASLSSAEDIDPPERHKDLPEKMSWVGTVTRCEPPNLIAHTWTFEGEDSEVCYELTEQGDKVLLVLTHSRLETEKDVLGVCGGWHTHLDILVDVLEGRQPKAFWKTYTPLEEEYTERLA
jgi:uncharacterized protein YndB with AHSA1/START domain